VNPQVEGDCEWAAPRPSSVAAPGIAAEQTMTAEDPLEVSPIELCDARQASHVETLLADQVLEIASFEFVQDLCPHAQIMLGACGFG
jgi:hypothetical protein